MFYTSCTHSPKLILYRNFCLSNIPGVGFPYEVLCQCSENFSTGFDAQHLKQISKQRTQVFLEDFRFYLQKSSFLNARRFLLLIEGHSNILSGTTIRFNKINSYSEVLSIGQAG